MYKDTTKSNKELLNSISRSLKQEKFLVISLVIVVFSIVISSFINSDITTMISYSYFIGIPTLASLVLLGKIKKTGIQGCDGKKFLIFTAFIILRTLGEISWAVYQSVLKIAPFPSMADVFWISGYAVLFAFLASYFKPMIRIIQPRTVIFASMITIGFLIPSILIAIENPSNLGPFELSLALAYTVPDAFIIFLLATTITHIYGLKFSSFFTRLLAAIILFIISDTLFIINASTYQEGNLVDLGWMCGYVLILSAILKSRLLKQNGLGIIFSTDGFEIKYKTISNFVAPLVTVMLSMNAFIIVLDFYFGHILGIANNENDLRNIMLIIIAIMTTSYFIISHYLSKMMSLIEAKDLIIIEQYKKLNLTNQQLAQIMLALDDAALVSTTDTMGNITYANKKFCEVSKYTEEELLGKNHRIIKSGFHPPEFYSDIWKTISSGKTWRGIIKNKAKDGSFYWVKSTISTILDEKGTPIKYVSVRTDITEQIELKEKLVEMERLSAIGELAARLAHDIRNPLSVIKNALSLAKLQNPNLSQVLGEHLKRIDKSILRITHQIDDVLDFVRPKPLVYTKTSLLEILNLTIERMVIPDTISLNLPQHDTVILGDVDKIEIVFTNLMMNSIQSMKNKGTIEISAADSDDHITIQIHDTGEGIPPHILPNIFDPLFTTRQIGTGLGLVTCKNIIEKHGGTIEAISTVGKGATFIIKLPKIKENLV